MFRPALGASAAFVLLASFLTLNSAAGAAPPAPCDVLSASTATQILGIPVTGRPSGSPALPSCIYLGQRPIVGFGFVAYQSEADASAMFKAHKAQPNVAYRQKGRYLLSAISMNHDGSKLAALLDAAAKRL